jgi:hypothetical protein
MANLYKVSEHSPEHSKPEISISLVKGGENRAIIKINKKVELDCNYREFKSFDLEGKSYTIELNNTFIEHWGKAYDAYVFSLKEN